MRAIFLFFLSIVSVSVIASDLSKLKKECLQGNLASCVKKEAILNGVGSDGELNQVIGEVKSTEEERMKQYRLDCDANVWISCHNLAVKYDKLNEREKSIELYNKACFSGSVLDSCYNLGVIFNKTKSKKEAKKAFEKACQLDHFVACYNLGILEFDAGNKGVAGKLFKKACNGKVSQACQKI